MSHHEIVLLYNAAGTIVSSDGWLVNFSKCLSRNWKFQSPLGFRASKINEETKKKNWNIELAWMLFFVVYRYRRNNSSLFFFFLNITSSCLSLSSLSSQSHFRPAFTIVNVHFKYATTGIKKKKKKDQLPWFCNKILPQLIFTLSTVNNNNNSMCIVEEIFFFLNLQVKH